ncbi:MULTISPECIES: ExbD/TolR family protein [unclassified Nitrosospira]|uniref:ExbD/TolR family protein n=1 Tax=unclassified Nitrosospira TaxID=2609267 RepID=UPI000D31F73C|nr:MULTISPECIES: biopolymer transporter ExbD [unclassified Nitrosospira]PTR14703.1 biopolymer transport protein ExbD [Nitrosospira sp. Nsp2]WON73232.1 biopolymer transporter ExbD [Nitrosospira sp. Is2]
MNFQRGRKKEEPEINLVPMIDVLLVILIFLVITTTYSKFSELEISLPQATSQQATESPNVINITVSANGSYTINRNQVESPSAEQISEDLRKAAGNRPDPVIVIGADAAATHQSVITVMEAARLAGYNHITFTTQNSR